MLVWLERLYTALLILSVYVWHVRFYAGRQKPNYLCIIVNAFSAYKATFQSREIMSGEERIFHHQEAFVFPGFTVRGLV